MLSIIKYGDERLHQKCETVADIGADLAAYLEKMFDAMREGNGIGLAAPQTGRTERFFVTNVGGDKPRAFINPEILMTSPEEAMYEEGCLSIPGIYTEIKRPARVSVQAWNERGRPFTLDADDLLARVILHEFDHLNGILFVDKLSAVKRKRVLEQYEKRFRA